jgi:mannose-6-phosphate isomerase-like protein (cupin superfamily)
MPTNIYGPGDNFDLEKSHVLAALIRKVHEAKLRASQEPLQRVVLDQHRPPSHSRCLAEQHQRIALPGRGPGPHRHPYDEVQFVREGRGLWTVNGEEFEAGAGDILVIKAGEIHKDGIYEDEVLRLRVDPGRKVVSVSTKSGRPRSLEVTVSSGRTTLLRIGLDRGNAITLSEPGAVALGL